MKRILLLGLVAVSAGWGQTATHVLSKDASEALIDAERGDPKRQYNLAFYYQIGGGGLPQDNAEASKWYRRSAENGYLDALDQLHGMCSRHAAIEQDCVYLVKALRPLADKGNAEAQYDLGDLTTKEVGIPRPWLANGPDFAQAAAYYRASADQGNWRAQMSLAYFYWEGKGVPQDFTLAYFWLNLATAGSPQLMQQGLATSRSQLGKQMTPDQIAEGQRMTREWKPK